MQVDCLGGPQLCTRSRPDSWADPVDEHDFFQGEHLYREHGADDPEEGGTQLASDEAQGGTADPVSSNVGYAEAAGAVTAEPAEVTPDTDETAATGDDPEIRIRIVLGDPMQRGNAPFLVGFERSLPGWGCNVGNLWQCVTLLVTHVYAQWAVPSQTGLIDPVWARTTLFEYPDSISSISYC